MGCKAAALARIGRRGQADLEEKAEVEEIGQGHEHARGPGEVRSESTEGFPKVRSRVPPPAEISLGGWRGRPPVVDGR